MCTGSWKRTWAVALTARRERIRASKSWRPSPPSESTIRGPPLASKNLAFRSLSPLVRPCPTMPVEPPRFIMYVDNPDYAAGLINTAMENAQQWRGPQAPPQMMMQGPPGGGGPAVGTKEKLKELTEMYQMGLVSPAEFESKKAQLLAGM
ncbi:unnamed protein product [Amoebophrya sp. A120]|nr:unnamed protein product [Amoebophrya sp. A120]|eukprot:GSA120T00000444001.1